VGAAARAVSGAMMDPSSEHPVESLMRGRPEEPRWGLRLLAATAALIAVALPGAAAADEPCWKEHRTGPYPVCFDPGNRLHLDLSTDGVGGGVQLRHVVGADDPDVRWRLEHEIAVARATRESIAATLYSGHYVRHASDGHVVLPFGRPRKLFLPFDIGAEAEVGALRGGLSSGPLQLGVVRSAVLFDLARSDSFGRRLAIGPAARWDVEVDRETRSAGAHSVAPLSIGALDLRAESSTGLTSATLRAEAGAVWSTEVGWRRWLGADAEIERVLVAVQDRPLSLFVAGSYSAEDEALSGWIGVRVAPLIRLADRGQGLHH
jgi:hypothetical protein